MKVYCAATYPSQQQRHSLGKEFYQYQDFHVTIGKEYTVLGVQFEVRSKIFGTGCWIKIVSDHGHLTTAPILLFTLVDGRISQFWEARLRTNSSFAIWPASFYKAHYFEDLSEGVVEVVRDFDRVRELIEFEFG
jgi:hypothetical protein